jgi:hypothetical protein
MDHPIKTTAINQCYNSPKSWLIIIMSITELLQSVDRLNEPDLDQLLDRVLLLRAKRKNNILSAAETDLLLQINQGVPMELHQQYQALKKKQDAEILTGEEYEELLELSDRIEILAAARAGSLVKLAQLRQVPLTQLMNELGIKAPSYV